MTIFVASKSTAMLISKEQFFQNIKHLLSNTFYKEEMLKSLKKDGEYNMDVDAFCFEDEDFGKIAAKQLLSSWGDVDDTKLKSVIHECIGVEVTRIKRKRLLRIIRLSV